MKQPIYFMCCMLLSYEKMHKKQRRALQIIFFSAWKTHRSRKNCLILEKNLLKKKHTHKTTTMHQTKIENILGKQQKICITKLCGNYIQRANVSTATPLLFIFFSMPFLVCSVLFSCLFLVFIAGGINRLYLFS